MVITVQISSDKTIAYISPCPPNGALHSELASLGGFNELRSTDEVTLPLSTEAATGLRKVLTGKPVSITPEVGKVLASFADSAKEIKPAHVFTSRTGKNAVADTQSMPISVFSRWKTYVQRNEGIRQLDEGLFFIPFELVPDVAQDFETLRIAPSLLTDNVVEARSKKASTPAPVQQQKPAVPEKKFEYSEVKLDELPPFAGFDGTLSSLRWVPLSAYEHIRSDSEKTSAANKRISASNAKLAKGGKKKPLKRSLNQKLSALGISSAFELLHYFPIRHIDRSKPKLIKQLSHGEEAAVVGYVISTETNYSKHYVAIVIEDMVGTRMRITLFNQMWVGKNFSKGDEVIAHGKYAPFNGSPSLSNPRIDKVGDERASLPMIPVYSQSEKNEITTWDILAMVKETLGRLGKTPLEDPILPEIREAYRIPERTVAYKNIHLPLSAEAFKDANRRLIYEELLRLQLFIQKQKNDITQRQGIVQNALSTPTLDKWMEGLPYDLTGAQKRAVAAVKENMAAPTPMHRLIQGDVGAGKSAIASMTVFNTIDNGHQAALLAPTEILAEQLHNGILSDAGDLASPRTGGPINIRFLGGKTRVAEARKIREGLADGSVDIVVGTHAILTEDTVYHDLGTVVIDEQHRFGVEQRTKLRNARSDGRSPDMLLMTATPIPRSSAMVLYGDLDITILDELPPGRTPIETIWIRKDAQEAVTSPRLTPWDDIREQVSQGHQAYIVASLVEDNEKIAAQSVEDAYEKLSETVFAGYRMGMVHGKQKRDDREAVMKAFAAGDIDILVSTTVIEVGVNVPNSTIMVVLDPGRFGIAQLHQIRGRVGRSSLASRCYLVGETKTEDGEFRLNALVESTDGFYLSEKDLELRGEGTLFSTKQSGQSDLYLAKISEHMHILEIAKKDAEEFLAKDPSMSSRSGRIFDGELEDIFSEREIKS